MQGLTASHRRSTVALVLFLLAGACSRPEPPGQVYQRLWSMYVSGNLPKTIQAVSKEADRWKDRQTSVWFWKFHLLHAEALLGQGKAKDAAALLKNSVPPLPALTQMALRRQVDLADASLISDRQQAMVLLDRAAAEVADPDLQIRIHLLRGVGLSGRQPGRPG